MPSQASARGLSDGDRPHQLGLSNPDEVAWSPFRTSGGGAPPRRHLDTWVQRQRASRDAWASPAPMADANHEQLRVDLAAVWRDDAERGVAATLGSETRAHTAVDGANSLLSRTGSPMRRTSTDLARAARRVNELIAGQVLEPGNTWDVLRRCGPECWARGVRNRGDHRAEGCSVRGEFDAERLVTPARDDAAQSTTAARSREGSVPEAPEQVESVGIPGLDGAQVLDEARAFVCRYVRLPTPHAEVAVTLWVAHTYAIEQAESTPYLGIKSPERRCGKTRLFETLALLVARPLMAMSATESALFRTLAEQPPPTLLLDEIDAIFKFPTAANEGLRGILNSGHRRGQYVLRSLVKGKTVEVEQFPVFAAKAFSGIGDLPETLADRSIVITMQRRTPDETVEHFRYKRVKPLADEVCGSIARWMLSVIDELDEDPDVPAALDDRAADGWEPLLAVADAAGGHWPRSARVAAVALSAGRNTPDDGTLGVRLLADVRTVFRGERMTSRELTAALVELEPSPWADIRGKPLSQHVLSRMLGDYGVRSKSIRLPDGSTPKGYERCQFVDAWGRYCQSESDPVPLETGLGSQHRHNATTEAIPADSNSPPPTAGGDLETVTIPDGDQMWRCCGLQRRMRHKATICTPTTGRATTN